MLIGLLCTQIRCLTELAALFPRPGPYCAGYGNKPTDVAAYSAVGMPQGRVFIVNKTGHLRHESCGRQVQS